MQSWCGRVQVTIVIEALKPGVVSLIRDLNGNHVIQRCLQARSSMPVHRTCDGCQSPPCWSASES